MAADSQTNFAPRYQGYVGASLVLGGVDVTGPHLYSIHPHGSTDKLPYVTMGECCPAGHGERFRAVLKVVMVNPIVCWELWGPQTTKIKLYLYLSGRCTVLFPHKHGLG